MVPGAVLVVGTVGSASHVGVCHGNGCGEAGCAGPLPAVMNAVVDALSEYGIHHIDMPATPFRVWQAIQTARTRTRDEVRIDYPWWYTTEES